MVANQSGSRFSSSTLAVLFPGNASVAKAKHNPSESQEVGKGQVRWRNQGRVTAVAGSGCKSRRGAGGRNRIKNTDSQATAKLCCQTNALLQSQMVGGGCLELQPVAELNELSGHLYLYKNNNRKTPSTL